MNLPSGVYHAERTSPVGSALDFECPVCFAQPEQPCRDTDFYDAYKAWVSTYHGTFLGAGFAAGWNARKEYEYRSNCELSK